jgi:hypothetical protein
MITTTKILGTILASLFALQAGLPSLGLEQPLSNIVALVVTVAIAGLVYFLKDTTNPLTPIPAPPTKA